MKKMIKIFISVLFAAMLFSGCRPDKFEDIGPEINVVSSFVGTWKLTKVTQRDEESARKGFPYSDMDITTLFPYTDFTITFNVDVNSYPTTFTSVQGNSPKIISLTSGQWSVGDAKYPTAIIFKNTITTEQVSLGAYPVGSNKTLQFKLERRDADPAANNKLLISYTYEFTKQ